MPVLTVYPPQPIHVHEAAAGIWESPFSSDNNKDNNNNNTCPNTTPVRSIHIKQHLRLRCRTQQLEKMVKKNFNNKLKKKITSSSASSSSSSASSFSSNPTPPTPSPSTTCPTVIKGILIKPSSILKLYQSGSSVTGTEIALVAGSTSVRCPSSVSTTTTHYKSVKRVRFSISGGGGTPRPQNAVIQTMSPLPTTLRSTDGSLNNESIYQQESQLEPVTETIFFTHSRHSYDRSPITVDKVLNKSLDLPPRTPIDAFSAGRWLPKSSTTSNLIPCDRIEEDCIPVQIIDPFNDNNLSAMRQCSMANTGEVVGLGLEERCTCECKDATNGGSLRATSTIHGCHKRKTTTMESSTSTREPDLTTESRTKYDEDDDGSSTTIDDHLTCHSFNKLKIRDDGTCSNSCCNSNGNGNGETCILQVDHLFGIGNWSRDQVFGSCDALDGF